MFMELPISGLHRLFHTLPASSQSLREKTSLESLTEETHTYDLLYPDYEALLHAHHNIYPLSQLDPTSVASAATSYDDRGDLDIQSSRDVRILVAQDGNAIAQQPRLLYDSHPPPSSRPPSGAGSPAGRGKVDVANETTKPGGSGKSSNGKVPHSTLTSKTSPAPNCSPSSPEYGQQSAFWGTLPRRNGHRSSVNNEETTQSRIAREGREETDALLGCMFGHTGLPLVSSTKLHINPAKSTTSQDGGASSGSLDLSSPRLFPKRRTPLTRSMTAEDFQGPTTTPKESMDKFKPMAPVKGPSILITRLFSVDLKESVMAKATTRAEASPLEQTGAAGAPDNKAKQIKVPKYGVAVLIQMPPAKRINPPSARLPPQRSRLGSSYEESSHLAPIRDRLSAEVGSMADGDSAAIDQDIERVVVHWSALTRAVSLLEGVARSAISTKLQDLIGHDMPLSSSATNIVRSPTKPDGRPKKYKQPSQRTLQLPSQSLQEAISVSTCARETSQRVVAALKTRRVITGQGRWGVWREEARWVGRWAGGKEQNFFLFNLLTAFLGNHTEWLESFGRNWTGNRRVEKTQRETDMIRHRTVIVSADKMAARRLIFLLSAFLPCSYQIPQAEVLTRPLSSRSSTGLSHSPPAGIPIPRERSLRRTINRKPRGNRTGSPIHLHERSISFTAQDPSTNEDNIISNHSVLGHSRRISDARSVRSLALPIPTSNAEMRKSSITTVSTLTPDCIAVPHFASPPTSTGGTAAAPRPGSSGSLASLSLRRTLSRSESNGDSLSPDSPSASRWGSMLSGFWSARRGSSTDHTDPMGSPRDGLGISGMQDLSTGRLAEMVEGLDTQMLTSHADNDQETLHGPPSPGTVTERTPDPTATAARDIPERPKAEEYPMKLSIDTNDGVVDIDLPVSNSLPSSFDSSMSSPRIPNTASSSFNDHASTYDQASHHSHDSVPAECPPAVDVAGYLKTYREDFALQAVRPYKGLKEDVKASMRAEADLAIATPKSANEICTTLIADTTTFSIIRLTLRSSDANSTTDSKTCMNSEHEITEEPLMDLDPTLISAVERVIGHSQPSSVAHSRAPSPTSRSKLHDHGEQRPTAHGSSTPSLDQVSRSECRTLVLGALEKVARSVSAERQTFRSDRSDEGKGTAGTEPDSTLREGVRRWLGETGR